MISPLEMTLFLLLASVVGVVLFRYLNLPPMLGYLTVGILVGPRALGIVPDTHGAQNLAEFGVVFLMFSIGLEFSLSKLRAMRHAVFGLGLSQVLGTILVALLLGLVLEPWVHITWQACVALGGALAMSSTAIVSKMLSERLEIESEHGRNIMGVLLFQDLAVVPLLIVIAAFGGSSASLVESLGTAAVKIVLALGILLIVGQKPGRHKRFTGLLPDLTGKRCAVFCTFALNPGRTLDKLQKIVEAHGGDVLGGMSIRRDDLTGGSAEFAERLVGAIAG